MTLFCFADAFTWFGLAEKRDINYAQDQKKLNQPVIKAMINLTEIDIIMDSSGLHKPWQCIKKVIENFDLDNATSFVYNLIQQPAIEEISSCYTSSSSWFDWIPTELFQYYWWAWALVLIAGIFLLFIILRVCCYACKKKDDDDDDVIS